MKRTIALLLLLGVFSVPALAGDVPFPPAPPCKENCGQSAASSPIPAWVILLVVSLSR